MTVARALIAAAAILLPAPALLGLHFRDGPPARVTGGLGEDSCAACHFGNAQNDAAGTLTLSGFPERFAPGETYALELTLTRPHIKSAGFQLAVRRPADRAQAGELAIFEDSAADAGLLAERGVQFAQHKVPAAPAAGEHAVRWRLVWTAPETAGSVTLHASVVAGDGDDSQAGDFVYTLERTAASP